MKILFINRMMGTAWGGGENYDYNLAAALQKLGHDVLFFSGRLPGAHQQDRVGGLEMVSIETPYVRRFMYQLAGKVRIVPGIFAELDRHLFQLHALQELERLLPHRGIQLVQILGMPQLAETLSRRGMPVVMRFPGPPAWFLSRLLKRFHRLPHTAIFSHGDAVRHVHDWLGFGIHNVPPGIAADYHPIHEPQRSLLRLEAGIDPDDCVLITVGRLIHGKGHDFLFDALPGMLRANARIRLVVVGDGALHTRLKNKAERLGVASRVIFTGHQGKESVARYLSLADIFCLLSEYENYSNATLEAMASGLPVLASRVGGFPLQVQEGQNGFLVDYNDVAGLTSRAIQLAGSLDLRLRLGAGAIRFASEFQWSRTAERVAHIYDEVLAA